MVSIPEERGPLGFPLGPVRRAIRGILPRGETVSPPESTPLDEYVRGLAKFSKEPEERIWRSRQIREYAKRFGMERVLEERLRRLG